MRRLENYIPTGAYYENLTQASNDILRAKTSLWPRLQEIEFCAKRDELWTLVVLQLLLGLGGNKTNFFHLKEKL